MKEAQTVLVGTATTVREALVLEESGMDAVVGQGSEAGGHRRTFIGGFEEALVGTIALVPQLADSVSVPVVAAGGIIDGRGLAAALLLGAEGVQMGTAFLPCPESGINQRYKEAVLGAESESTALTRSFSGKPARGIRNRFMDEMDGKEVPEYPVQNAYTRDIRAAAAREDAYRVHVSVGRSGGPFGAGGTGGGAGRERDTRCRCEANGVWIPALLEETLDLPVSVGYRATASEPLFRRFLELYKAAMMQPTPRGRLQGRIKDLWA